MPLYADMLLNKPNQNKTKYTKPNQKCEYKVVWKKVQPLKFYFW